MVLNATDVKFRAAGQWPEILATVAGIPRQLLDGSHTACPRCGGSDRFRLVDEQAGAVLCNQCFHERNGDGLSAVQWMLGCGFPEAMQRVAEHLGMSAAGTTTPTPPVPGSSAMIPAPAGSPSPVPPPGTNTLSTPSPRPKFEISQHCVRAPAGPETDEAYRQFAAAKGPTTPEAVKALGGTACFWPAKKPLHKTICFLARQSSEEWACGAILYRQDGAPFPVFGKLDSRKTHQPGGSKEGWVTDWKRLEAATHVWRVEGIPDALALTPHLPDDQAVITNISGCQSIPKNHAPFTGKHLLVIGDADRPGQMGAERFANTLLAVAASVKRVPLPYAIVEDHGKDLRDYFAEGNTFDALLQLAMAQPVLEGVGGVPSIQEMVQEGKEAPSLLLPAGRTHIANGIRFANKFREEALYLPEWSKWHAWDGQRWVADIGSLRVQKLAGQLAASLFDEAKALGDSSPDKEIEKFAAASSQAPGLNATLLTAATWLHRNIDELDKHPFLLNCPNGTLELRTGELREHRRSDMLTQLCPTPFIPEAESELFQTFLEEIFRANPEVIGYMQRLLGYCLTGSVQEHIFPIWWGGGSNGKSTLTGAVRAVLGEDYSATIPAASLLVRQGEQHPTELTIFHQKRFVVASETTAAAVLNEALVKQLTGGDKITARRMREDFWEFEPTHKIMLLTNPQPGVKGLDNGIWRRLQMIPFLRKFEEVEKDPTLPEKLKEAAEAILAWMVQGCRDWLEDGLRPPDVVTSTTGKFRGEQNTIGRFIDECCLKGQNAYVVKFASLYDRYKEWTLQNGESEISGKMFGSRLREIGFDPQQRRDGRWFTGLTLRASSGYERELGDEEATSIANSF